MGKTILIIGAGMGGLAAGIYGQKNGYNTQIFEAHTLPGGQCTGWERKDYVFDSCVHHLMGCHPDSQVYALWEELGAMPRETALQEELVAVADSSGNIFYDYYDLDRLREHMLNIAPEDREPIEQYIEGIRSFVGQDLMGRMVLDKKRKLLRHLPAIFSNRKAMGTSLAKYAETFQNPFLRRAIPLLEYSLPDIPAGVHYMKHAAATWGDIRWPLGGGRSLSHSMAERYKELGGTLHLNSGVAKILTEDGRATGVRLQNGKTVRGDIVISNADGRKTIQNMLDGQFTTPETEAWCSEPEDTVTNWGTMVFLGVDRDLSQEPSSLILLLDEPVTLTDHKTQSLELQLYGCDLTMAPAGKGVIKAELMTPYSYWADCTPEEYGEKKQQVTAQVLGILEKRYPGITGQVEVSDVVTLRTWERFMGGTRGFQNGPNKPFSFSSMLGKPQITLKGLEQFYFCGIWATGMGALFANAYSGKQVVQAICKQDKKHFEV